MATELPRGLKLSDEWRVPVCVPHTRCVAPSCVNAHLRECHGKLDLPTR